MEEAELLLPVSSIVRGVEVEDDLLRSAAESPFVPAKDCRRQHLAQLQQLTPTYTVFHSRDRRLRSKTFPVNWIPTKHQFMDRVIGQRRRIIGVRVTQRNPKQPLTHRLLEAVRHLARLAVIAQTSGQRLGQPQLLIHRLEQ